jgi:methanogenic corrinoid protein MtbC1
MEMFLPEMTLAANAMQAVLRSVEPELGRLAEPRAIKGKVVIGTVHGDMHSIGKDIVVSLLRVQGFEVHDLGVDVDPLALVKKAREVNADAIGASALMTTTMPGQRVLVELLKTMGLRQRFHVILGGGPVTQEWVNKCEADSWGENAWTAVKLLERAAAERRA